MWSKLSSTPGGWLLCCWWRYISAYLCGMVFVIMAVLGGSVTWGGYIVRYTSECGELLSYIAPYICFPIAYRFRKRRWLCLWLVVLPAILALPMALCLGWRGWPLG